MSYFPLGECPEPTPEPYSSYFDNLYDFFQTQILDASLTWTPGQHLISFRRNPEAFGRHESFWHAVSGEHIGSADRIPEPERCKRLSWIRHMIEEFNCIYPENNSTLIKWWVSDRNRTRPRYMIAVADFSYVVIVEQRPTYAIFVTAFFVERPRRRKKFEREHDDFWA